MKNEQIIFNERLQLMRLGVIGSTGNILVVKDEKGNNRKIKEPEQIHCFSRWKKQGYKVKKGEKAVASIRIWLNTSHELDRNSDSKDMKNKMIMKPVSFFSQSQVELKNN